MIGNRRHIRFQLISSESRNNMHKHIDKRPVPRVLEHELADIPSVRE